MKMRIVIELEYPEAVTDCDEAAVKTTLSAALTKIAREQGFDVERVDDEPYRVSEVMVGCAKIESPPPGGAQD